MEPFRGRRGAHRSSPLPLHGCMHAACVLRFTVSNSLCRAESRSSLGPEVVTGCRGAARDALRGLEPAKGELSRRPCMRGAVGVHVLVESSVGVGEGDVLQRAQGLAAHGLAHVLELGVHCISTHRVSPDLVAMYRGVHPRPPALEFPFWLASASASIAPHGIWIREGIRVVEVED